MNSETSIEEIRPSAGSGRPELVEGRLKPDPTLHRDQSLQPWQFFVLAGLGCATAVTFIVRGEGITAVVLLTVMMGTIALAGLAALRAVKPLFGGNDDRTVMIGERTRVALEREKMLALRAIKELEFDHAMGKIADDDFKEMSARLRERAIRLMKQLDAGTGYRDRVEQDLKKRLAAAPSPKTTTSTAAATKTCNACSTGNDPDARFCKGCGQPL